MDINIKNAIENDGYIYCIIGCFIEKDNTIIRTCKIGKTEMKQSESCTLQSLLNRYSTYIPDCKIYKFIRVSDCHKAENDIFNMLTNIHYKKEHYYFEPNIIDNTFNEIKIRYPDVNTLIINSDINTISNFNKQLREKF